MKWKKIFFLDVLYCAETRTVNIFKKLLLKNCSGGTWSNFGSPPLNWSKTIFKIVQNFPVIFVKCMDFFYPQKRYIFKIFLKLLFKISPNFNISSKFSAMFS